MDQNMYDDADPQAAPPAPEKEGGEEEGGATAVLPKSILEGKSFEPGDELVLKVLRINDDSLEVAYAPAKEQEKGGEGEGAAPAAEAPPSEMASMME